MERETLAKKNYLKKINTQQKMKIRALYRECAKKYIQMFKCLPAYKLCKRLVAYLVETNKGINRKQSDYITR